MKKRKKNIIPFYSTIRKGKKKGPGKVTVPDENYVEALRDFSIEHKL